MLARKVMGLATARITPYIQSLKKFSSGSSIPPKIPVVRQLVFHDEYDIKNEKWWCLEQRLTKGSILRDVSTDSLIRPEDIAKYGPFVTGNLAARLLKDGCALATINLMRGVNVSPLMKLNNLLWSGSYGGIMFNHTDMADNGQGVQCPFLSLYELFCLIVEISTKLKLNEIWFPYELAHLLSYLKNATLIDKRLINNHSVIKLPGERIYRNSRINHVLRRQFQYDKSDPKGPRAEATLEKIAKIFPPELLNSEGIHPGIDYWAAQAQAMHDKKASQANSTSLGGPMPPGGTLLEVHLMEVFGQPPLEMA